MDDPQLLHFMTAEQVAKEANVTKRRINQLCQDGRIKATKIANIWLINRKSALEWIYSERKAGRPPKRKRDGESRTRT